VPPFQILTIARLTAKKGLPTIYQALRILCDQGIRLRHTHIGGGEDRELIMSLIKKLDLESVTELLGTQPHEVVSDHYRDADLFVLGCEVAPNGDRDGIPNVLAESMAMGLPVVATRISGIPELVENERTGLLVPPGQPAKLAQSMLRLLTDEELRNRCIAAGKKQVTQTFDNRQLIRELAGIYHNEGLGPGLRAGGRGHGAGG